jgi:hypothetical protein
MIIGFDDLYKRGAACAGREAHTPKGISVLS